MINHFEWYISASIRLNENALAISLLSGFIHILMAVVLFMFYKKTLKKERWLAFLSYAFATYGTFQIYMTLTSDWPTDIGVVLPFFIGLIFAAARELKFIFKGKKVFVWSITITFLLLSLILNICELPSPLHRLPISVIAIILSMNFCWRLAENLHSKQKTFSPHHMGQGVLGISYLCFFILFATNPYLANIQIGLDPWESFPRANTNIPLMAALDNLTNTGFFLSNLLLFTSIVSLVVKRMFILSGDEEMLEDVVKGGTDYLDRKSNGGILGAIGKSLAADHVSLVLLNPGKSPVIWWGWFSKDYRDSITQQKMSEIHKKLRANNLHKGFTLHQVDNNKRVNLASPMNLTPPPPEHSITSVVLKKGETITSANWKTDHQKTWIELVPDTLAFITAPIFYHGAIIGVLNIESRSSRSFSSTTKRRLERQARFIAPTLHGRRELLAQNQLMAELEHIIRSGSKKQKFMEVAVEALQRILNPLGTVLIFRIGFKRICVASNGKRMITKVFRDNGTSSLDEMTKSMHFDSDQFHHAWLQVSSSTKPIGWLAFIIPKEDNINHPSLGRDPLLRASIAKFMTNACIENNNAFFQNELRTIERTLESAESVKDCEDILKVLKHSSNLKWVKIQDNRSLLKGASCQIESQHNEALSFFITKEPVYNSICIISHRIIQHKFLYLGIKPFDFERELSIPHSPWVAFIERLALLVSAALSRINIIELERMTNQMEIDSQREILHSLWLHELGNKSAQINTAIGMARDSLEFNDIDETHRQLESLQKQTEDFKEVALSINKTFSIKDRDGYTLSDVYIKVKEFYSTILNIKSIAIAQDASLDQYRPAQTFSLVYLVLSNLVGNAIKALKTRADGVTGSITIVARHEGEWIYCTVIDNGRGIKPENQNKIFNPGFSTDSEKHSGMGLFGSRKAIRKSGGDLFLHKSSPNEGAEFVVKMNRRITENIDDTLEQTDQDDSMEVHN